MRMHNGNNIDPLRFDLIYDKVIRVNDQFARTLDAALPVQLWPLRDFGDGTLNCSPKPERGAFIARSNVIHDAVKVIQRRWKPAKRQHGQKSLASLSLLTNCLKALPHFSHHLLMRYGRTRIRKCFGNLVAEPTVIFCLILWWQKVDVGWNRFGVHEGSLHQTPGRGGLMNVVLRCINAGSIININCLIQRVQRINGIGGVAIRVLALVRFHRRAPKTIAAGPKQHDQRRDHQSSQVIVHSTNDITCPRLTANPRP